MYLGEYRIDDYVTLIATTHRFSSGAAYAPTSITYRVYEDATALEIVADTAMTNFDLETGFYLDRIQCTAALGYEVGKTYTALIKATVDSVAAITAYTWRILTPPVNMTQVAGTTQTAGDLAALITTVDTVVDVIAVDVAGLDGAAMRGTDNAALASVCTETRLAELDAANLPTDVANVKTDTAAVLVDTGTDGVIVNTHTATGKAEINAEVVDVVATDTIAELAQGIPTATPTIRTGLMLLYMALRNKLDVDASNKEIHNDAGTVICKKALTDDGTTYSEAEMVSGP